MRKRKHNGRTRHAIQVHIPGYNYCGPGTVDFSKKPINALDALCREHDLDYQKIIDDGGNPYTSYNWADKKFAKSVETVRTERLHRLAKYMVRKTFDIKRQLLDEGESSELEPPSKRHKQLTEKVNVQVGASPSINQSTTSTNQEPTTMAGIKRGNRRSSSGNGAGRKRKNVPKRAFSKITRKSRRKAKGRSGRGLFQAIAAGIAGPPRTVELNIVKNVQSTVNTDLWVDPVVWANATPTYNTYNPFQALGRTNILALAGETTSTQQFWLKKRQMSVDFTNHSNSTMYVTAYLIRVKVAYSTAGGLYPLTMLDELLSEVTSTTIYTEDDGNLIFNYANPTYATASKLFTLEETVAFRRHFQIVRKKKFQMEPAESRSFNHWSSKLTLYDYYSNQRTWMPGDVFMLLKVSSKVEADGTTATAAAFPIQAIALNATVRAFYSPRQNLARRVHTVSNSGLLGTDPRIIDDTITEMVDDN